MRGAGSSIVNRLTEPILNCVEDLFARKNLRSAPSASSMLKPLIIIRVVLLIGAIYVHFLYYRICSNKESIPTELVAMSSDPNRCRAKSHYHQVYLPFEKTNPKVFEKKILYNLGEDACNELTNRVSSNNVFHTLGRKIALILRKNGAPALIAKVDNRLFNQEETSSSWAKKIAASISCSLRLAQVGLGKNCSLRHALQEVNKLQPYCHSAILEDLLLSRKPTPDHSEVVTVALHPALLVIPQIRRQSASDDSWPFAKYLGGCGMFALTEYVGCPLSDFYYEEIPNKIRIAMKVLDVALHLDTRFGLHKGIYYKDFHNGNLGLGTDGRVYITDTDQITLLLEDADVEKEDSWTCHPGRLQNSHDVLTGILSTVPSQKGNEKELFDSFLNGLDQFKDSLGLPPHPKIPDRTNWNDMDQMERLVLINEVVESFEDVLYVISSCSFYDTLRWLITVVGAILWVPSRFIFCVNRRYRRIFV